MKPLFKALVVLLVASLAACTTVGRTYEQPSDPALWPATHR